ncbi:hypothetical protein Bbelb_444060 [Branchiostoma belcheri]|nr:hypothetical protein Bbelb_444060 [Branchiostoma belcheri]
MPGIAALRVSNGANSVRYTSLTAFRSLSNLRKLSGRQALDARQEAVSRCSQQQQTNACALYNFEKSKMSGSRRTYRTLPLDVPHSPAERIALSRWTYRTLPREVPHSVLHSPAERPSKIDAYFVACAEKKEKEKEKKHQKKQYGFTTTSWCGQRIGTNKELQRAYLDYHRHEMMAGPQTFIMSYVSDYGDASLRRRAYQYIYVWPRGEKGDTEQQTFLMSLRKYRRPRESIPYGRRSTSSRARRPLGALAAGGSCKLSAHTSLREKHPQMELSRPPRHRATFPALGGFTVKAAEGNVSKLISVKSVSAKASVDRTAANYPNIFSLLCRYTGKLKHFAPGVIGQDCRPSTEQFLLVREGAHAHRRAGSRATFAHHVSCSSPLHHVRTLVKTDFPRERESNFPAQPGELAEDGTVARRREPR